MLFFLLLVVCSASVFAQTCSISGKVSDEKGQPLSGASVIIKGTPIGTTANSAGIFTIGNVKSGSITFIISSGGFGETQVAVNGGDQKIDVSLEDAGKSVDEVIVTGVFDKKAGSICCLYHFFSKANIKTLPKHSSFNLINTFG